MAKDVEWQNYEQTAVYLLDQIAAQLGLDRVEGQQKLIGESGATWSIDGKGVKIGDEGIVIIECRRRKRRQDQEAVASLAFRIKDNDARGAILVTPLDLQKGAKLVANHVGIIPLFMDKHSTRTDYLLRFLNQVFAGTSATVTMTASASGVVTRTDGTKETIPAED